MRRCALQLAMVAIVCCASLTAAARPPPASHVSFFSGTADGLAKPGGRGLAGLLNDAIAKWKADNKVVDRPSNQTAEKPAPHPYWRSAVSPELFLAPDVVTDTSYTLCWKGVVSPVVCTSGAKVCW